MYIGVEPLEYLNALNSSFMMHVGIDIGKYGAIPVRQMPEILG